MMVVMMIIVMMIVIKILMTITIIIERFKDDVMGMILALLTVDELMIVTLEVIQTMMMHWE
jgi:hypothetical protein